MLPKENEGQKNIIKNKQTLLMIVSFDKSFRLDIKKKNPKIC